jgi:ABC-2 type transport system permease protein
MQIKIKKPQLSPTKFLKLFIAIGSNTLAQIFVLVAALIAINIFSQKYFLRLDLTETQTYTLSQGTKNILNSLEDTVTIKTYFSEDLPPDVIPVIQNIKDIRMEK